MIFVWLSGATYTMAIGEELPISTFPEKRPTSVSLTYRDLDALLEMVPDERDELLAEIMHTLAPGAAK